MQVSDSTKSLSPESAELLSDSNMLYQQAMSEVQRGNFDQAIKLLESMLMVEKGLGQVYTALGHCYCMRNEDEKSVGAYQAALQFASQAKDPEVHFGLGSVYLRNKAYKKAVLAFQAAADIGKRHYRLADIYRCLGTALESIRQFSPAISSYTQAIALSPLPLHQAFLHAAIARSHCKNRKKSLCFSSLSTASELAPESIKVTKMWAWCALTLGESELALEKAQIAMRVSEGQDGEVQFLLGMSLLKLGDVDRAFSSIALALSKYPASPLAWCVLGSLYGKKNQLREAHSCFIKSLQANPRLPETLRNIAFLYFTSSRPKIAKICLKKAGELMKVAVLHPENRYFYPYFEVGDDNFLETRQIVDFSGKQPLAPFVEIDLRMFSESYIKKGPEPALTKKQKLGEEVRLGSSGGRVVRGEEEGAGKEGKELERKVESEEAEEKSSDLL